MKDEKVFADADDLELQIDMLEGFDANSDDKYNTQLICWLKELQRRRAAMQADSVSTAYQLPDGWISEAKKLAELHGISFVVFRNGEQPQCADPRKVIISFTDEGLGYPAAPEQEV